MKVEKVDSRFTTSKDYKVLRYMFDKRYRTVIPDREVWEKIGLLD